MKPLKVNRGQPWTPSEDAIIIKHATEGSRSLHNLIPWRRMGGIRRRARRLKVVIPHGHFFLAKHQRVAEHVHPLVKELFAELKRRNLSMQSLGKVSGVSVGSVANWKRNGPGLVNFLAVLNSIDLDLSIVPREPPDLVHGQCEYRVETPAVHRSGTAEATPNRL